MAECRTILNIYIETEEPQLSRDVKSHIKNPSLELLKTTFLKSFRGVLYASAIIQVMFTDYGRFGIIKPIIPSVFSKKGPRFWGVQNLTVLKTSISFTASSLVKMIEGCTHRKYQAAKKTPEIDCFPS